MVSAKTCFKCGEMKPLGEFYAHPMMLDGHLNKCKVCNRRDVQDNYKKRRPQYLDYEKRRYGPKKRAIIDASKKRHPEHEAARYRTKLAIGNGTLRKQPCEKCGAVRVDAHHDDYSKPLEVRWLCRKHHGEVHRIERIA